MTADYYWCFKHRTVEQGRACKAANRFGPYESPEAARGWKERLERRDEAWAADDERWHGTDEDEPG